MIPELAELLKNAVLSTLEDRVAVSFSGGLDSTLIAKVAQSAAQVELFTAGVEGASDIEYAEKIAAEMHLPLVKCMMDENEVLDNYKKCYKIVPNEFLKVELLVPIYRLAAEAKKKGHSVLLFGSGSEELFIGYERYYTYASERKNLDVILRDEYKILPQREISWIGKVCRHFGIEARFPFYNKKLSEYVFNSIPLEIRMEDYELKKGVLREAAAFLSVPELAVKRKKKALQYGSGIHKVLLKHPEIQEQGMQPSMNF